MKYISLKELRELRVKQLVVIDGEKRVITLGVDRDLYFETRKAINVKLVKDCQGW